MIEILIRPARLVDAQSLHCNCYPAASFDEVHDYLAWCLRQIEKGRMVRFVAEADGHAVGNVQLTVWGDVGEVGSLVVAESYRRMGLASRMLNTVVAEARARGLVALEISVEQRQPAILSFYEQVGFQQIGETKEGLSYPTSPGPIVHLQMVLGSAA